MLISIDGTDGAGKNTQACLLADRVRRAGRGAAVYSFPRYDTLLGAAIRRHLLKSVALTEERMRDSSDHNADGLVYHVRAPEDALVFQCMNTVDKLDASAGIVGHLANGRVVICDRWTASAVAYGVADGLDAEWLKRTQARLPQAHLTIFLDVPEDESLRRRPNLRDRYEKDREKQKVVRANYAAMSLTRVDGVGSVEEVTERIWSHVVKHPEWE